MGKITKSDDEQHQQDRLLERLALSNPREFSIQMAWTAFSASLGASFGVLVVRLPLWMLPIVLLASPLLAALIVFLAWMVTRAWAQWIVNMAWSDYFSDPCGHCPACPECHEAWVVSTKCCGDMHFNAPKVNDDGDRVCAGCEQLNPVYVCCGNPIVRDCGTIVDGKFMTEEDWKRRPAIWQDWKPRTSDILRSIFRIKPRL